MRLIDIRQRTPEWERWRSEGVTASEAPVVLGVSPYKTPWRLWAERVGLVRPEDLSGNPHVARGVALEDAARQAVETRLETLLLPACGEKAALKALVPELAPETLERYRRRSTERVRVTVLAEEKATVPLESANSQPELARRQSFFF